MSLDLQMWCLWRVPVGLAFLAISSCVAADQAGATNDKAKDFWSFFETGEMGAGEIATPYDPSQGASVPDLLNPATFGSAGSPGETQPAIDPDYIPPINWYQEFGDQIMVRESTDEATGETKTYITKPYRLPLGRGQKLLDLMKFYGNFTLVVVDPAAVAPSEPPGPGIVEATNLAGWEVENYGNLRTWPPAPMNSSAIGDRLLVTTEAEMLYEVEDFVDLFMSEVPQIEIEAKIIEVIDTDEMYFGIRPPDGIPMFDFPDGTLIDSFDYSLPSGASGNQALLSVSGIHDGTQFNAILEAVAALENVEVDSRPKIAVREGGVASIEATQDVPYYSFTGINSGSGAFNANLTYKTVGIKLYVSPHIVGSKTLSLFVEVESSSESGSIVTFVTDTGGSLSTPRITTQVARTTVYLEPGQAVIIAGLTTERKVDNVRKVPLLGDIPILGRLFRSDGSKTVRSHTLFYIKPRILQGIDRTYDF
jgi:type II secretory pathway component GspD/PulD (secretin)